MDADFESIFQQRPQHRSAVRLIVPDGTTCRHVEAFAIEPCGATDDLVDDVLWIAAKRQSDELAHGRIHGFESIRSESCPRRRK
jgi:hypothetical protein